MIKLTLYCTFYTFIIYSGQIYLQNHLQKLSRIIYSLYCTLLILASPPESHFKWGCWVNGGRGVQKVGFLLVITNSQIAHSIKLQLWYYAGRSFTHNHCYNYKCAPLFTIYKLTVKSRIFVYNDHLYHRATHLFCSQFILNLL